MRPAIYPHPPLSSYALIDSGGAEKLERFGEVVLRRPDPQALWRRRLDEDRWAAADLSFVRESDRGGRWVARPGGHRASRAGRGRSPEWPVDVRGATLLVRPTPFKHVGLFPEQAANWDWVVGLRERLDREPPPLLNLFGYTGAASVLASRAGYAVTHVDASRTSLAWARENSRASGLADDAIRTILDDAAAFVRREARRGARYAGVLVDPPHYGRGPKGEKWQLETDLGPLLAACASLLAERAFLVVTTYAVGLSPLALANLVAELEGGVVEAGELALPEQDEGGAPRLLPCGFSARWKRGLERE